VTAQELAKRINDAVYAKGAPLGSPEYFEVRELCTRAFKSIPDYGHLMTLGECGGFGRYACELGMTDIVVRPSDVAKGTVNKYWTSVVWFNK